MKKLLRTWIFCFVILPVVFIGASCNSKTGQKIPEIKKTENVTNNTKTTSENSGKTGELSDLEKVKNFNKNNRWPRGQNGNIFADGKRIIKDQYEFDDAKKDLDFYLSTQTVFQTEIIDPNKPEPIPRNKILMPSEISPEIFQQINDRAKKVDQPLFDNAFYREFSVPSFDDQGKTKSLSLFAGKREDRSVPGWGINNDQGPGNTGLSRFLPNDFYHDLSKITFSITFNNNYSQSQLEAMDPKKRESAKNSQLSWRGTMFAIDYQKPTDNTYPTTWYFLTNIHVAGKLQKENDSENPSSLTTQEAASQAKWGKTTKIFLMGIDFTNINQKTSFSPSLGPFPDPSKNPYKVLEIPVANVKTIISGTEFFNLKVSDISEEKAYQGAKNLIDLAILEIKFPDETTAKNYTHDYANWKDNQKFTIARQTFLDKDYYLNFPENNLYINGFGNTGKDRRIAGFGPDFNNFSRSSWASSYWTNKDKNLANAAFDDLRWEKGSDFSWSRTYRSFENLPGLTDIGISLPKIDDFPYEFKNQKYVNFGLGYLVDHYAAPQGVSGSPVVNGSRELYGAIFVANEIAGTGVVAALKSPGFDYQGYYGKYNLPQYDFIYGGGKDQIKSYVENLVKMYGETYQTYLFPQGLKTKKT